MRYTQAPPMGWNSWNSGVILTERSVKETIDAIISSGMRQAGYEYVILDAGWAAPTRDADGRLQADHERFPNGIGALARYAHDRSLLLGLYSSPFNEICGQSRSNASTGHEVADAQQFAEWEVDYLKYDWCRLGADRAEQVRVFTAMRDALHASGRRIFYSINPHSSFEDEAAGNYDWSGIADMVRSGGDLVPVWENRSLSGTPDAMFDLPGFLGVGDYFTQTEAPSRYESRSYWLDPDMLVVGVTWSEWVASVLAGLRHKLLTDHPPTVPQMPPELGLPIDDVMARLSTARAALTSTEQQFHFSLWAMLGAPLIAGNDVRNQSRETNTILTNRDVIAIDQDPLGVAYTPLGADSRVWVKPLSDGSTAVAFFNPAGQPTSFTTTTSELGMRHGTRYIVRDLWSQVETPIVGSIHTAPIPPHGVVLIRLTPRLDQDA